MKKELTKAVAKVEQYQHQAQRIENRYCDYQESRRKRRTQRVIARGGAVERIAPQVRGLSERAFYVLGPIRPIEPHGKWGCKQRRRYRLDEDGKCTIGEDGKPLFDAVPTTDWGSSEVLER